MGMMALHKLVHSMVLSLVNACVFQTVQVFKVGTTQRRYVSRRHAKVWLVQIPLSRDSSIKPRECDVDSTDTVGNGLAATRSGSILYQCRLWRHFNGSLNWQCLQTMLQRVLTYLMAHPGCSMHKLCYVLNPDVLPATTMDVVDILEELGCVELLRVQKPTKPTMFSVRRRNLSLGDSIQLEESVSAINVLIEAPIRLAYFIDLAVKHCQGK